MSNRQPRPYAAAISPIRISGFGVGGLPVSVQIAAKPFGEATLLRAAHAFEGAAGFRAKRPAVAPRSAAEAAA